MSKVQFIIGLKLKRKVIQIETCKLLWFCGVLRVRRSVVSVQKVFSRNCFLCFQIHVSDRCASIIFAVHELLVAVGLSSRKCNFRLLFHRFDPENLHLFLTAKYIVQEKENFAHWLIISTVDKECDITDNAAIPKNVVCVDCHDKISVVPSQSPCRISQWIQSNDSWYDEDSFRLAFDFGTDCSSEVRAKRITDDFELHRVHAIIECLHQAISDFIRPNVEVYVVVSCWIRIEQDEVVASIYVRVLHPLNLQRRCSLEVSKEVQNCRLCTIEV
jgi:hypothetical protein